MIDYNGIIEMEILNGIDRAFHKIMVDSDKELRGLALGHGYKNCRYFADRLQSILPNYIDKQCDLIGRKSEYITFMKKVQEDNPNIDVHIPSETD